MASWPKRIARLAAAGAVALWVACGDVPNALAAELARAEGGIRVTGHASIAVEPDLAVLRMGVQATAATVAEARRQAAEAMAVIEQAAKDKGLADEDRQTISFGIGPEYRYMEADATRRRPGAERKVRVGYTVSQTQSIKLRDLPAVGAIIDHLAEAGGDAVRMHGLEFGIENPKAHMATLRERAVADALAKAEHLASLVGVAVGELLYINETAAGDGRPWPRAAAMVEAHAAATPISAGELELDLGVEAVFAIE
jgi:hypothetical protein